MSLSRPALVAILVGLALLSSPALLLQFQEPTECRNSVEPAADADVDGSTPVFQYEELSPDAKRAFDRAQDADLSVAVYGERCPAEFTYSAGREKYVVVKDETRYLLRTYAGDLLPEVPIAAGLLAFLGLVVGGTGLAARGDADTRFPLWAGALALLALVAVSVAIVLEEHVLTASGVVGLIAAGTLVGAGAALRPRRALVLGGAFSLLPAAILVPLVGVSVWFLVPAFLPLLLVGAGVGLGRVGTAIGTRTATQ